MKTFPLKFAVTPSFRYYAGIGMLALVLQRLMQSAEKYRYPGRYGSEGPQEILCGYSGCVNCDDHPWHSERDKCVTHRDHVRQIQEDIIQAILDGDPIWKTQQGINFDTLFKFRGGTEYNCGEETAWNKLRALHGKRRTKASLNKCHPIARTLCFPQIFIGRESIWLDMRVTYSSELKSKCASSWSIPGLLRRDCGFKWNPNKGTFAAHLEHCHEFLLQL